MVVVFVLFALVNKSRVDHEASKYGCICSKNNDFENAFACNEISQSGLGEDALLSRESGGKRNSVPFPLLLVCIGKQVPRYVVVHVSRGKQ